MGKYLFQLPAPSWYEEMIENMFFFNCLWPSDVISRHRSESTLALVMACCLTAKSHFLNQGWLLSSKVFCKIHLGAVLLEVLMNLIVHVFGDYTCKINTTSPRGQWVNLVISPDSINTLVSPWANELTHCGLVMPYGDIDLGQHWLR